MKRATTWGLLGFSLLAVSGSVWSAAITRRATGINAAAIQATVDQFRADLGGVNNGVGGSFPTGRREINWDGVPDTAASPNGLPFDFFNVTSARGVTFSSPNSTQFRVSADSSNPDSAPVRFGDVDSSYTSEFTTFSSQRLFGVLHSNAQLVRAQIVEIQFFVPGTQIPATVSGFGSVFTDVDVGANVILEYYSISGERLTNAAAQATDQGLSFVGVSFNAGERIARVRIISGSNLASGNTDGVSGRDVVAMDDFIYGEPVSIFTIFENGFDP